MCRGTVAPDLTAADSTSLVLERLRQQLAGSSGSPGPAGALAGLCGAPGALGGDLHLAASRGSGPRLFCGHVPPECSEELVKAHFSQWGHVVDVYFPKRKDTFRRRPFCFVTFSRLEDAQRALAESPMNICGIPIKQLNLVEDRADYYKHRHQAAQSALVQALQTLALLGNDGQAAAAAALAAAPALAPQAPAPAPPAMDLGELAALLSLESAQNAQMNGAARPQPFPMHQPMNMAGMNAYAEPSMAPRYANSGSLPPFANLPGFSQAGLTAQASAGMAMPAAQPAYMSAPPAQPAFPPASAAALAAALAGPMGAAPRLPTGASSPFSTLDAQAHPSAASSPPKGELVGLPAGLPLVQPRSSLGSGSSGSASPDLDTAAANRLAMWQLQNELLADSAAAPADWPAAATQRLPATATVN